jgi:hypothetical protein
MPLTYQKGPFRDARWETASLTLRVANKGRRNLPTGSELARLGRLRVF